MSRLLVRAVLTASISSLPLALASAQQAGPMPAQAGGAVGAGGAAVSPVFERVPVTATAFMVRGGGGNAMFVVARDGVILVDTKSAGQANFDALMANIAAVTELPVRQVVVTHHHPDHAGNIAAFAARNIPVLGSARMQPAYELLPVAARGRLAPPTMTYDRRTTVRVAGTTAAISSCTGHSGNDSVVFFPLERIVAAGDVVEDTPAIDYPSGASIAGWLACLDRIAGLRFDRIVPGHGPAALTREQFLRYRADVTTFVERARAAARTGIPRDQLLAAIKVDDLSWRPTNPGWKDARRLDGFYAELIK